MPSIVWTLDLDSPIPAWRLREADPDVILAFSTRLGGVSAPPFDTLNLGRSTEDRAEAVAENRARILRSLELDPETLATAGQVHGARVTQVLAPGLHPECDALVTRVPRIALAVTTADCLPILLTAPGVAAAVHAGWRGLVAGAPSTALAALGFAADRDRAEVTAHLGPSIRSCCYRVGPEVARQFPATAVRMSGDQQHLDLVAAARLQLLDAGVSDSRIHVVPACTACEAERYFSHRRDRGRTGRHWAIVALRG